MASLKETYGTLIPASAPKKNIPDGVSINNVEHGNSDGDLRVIITHGGESMTLKPKDVLAWAITNDGRKPADRSPYFLKTPEPKADAKEPHFTVKCNAFMAALPESYIPKAAKLSAGIIKGIYALAQELRKA